MSEKKRAAHNLNIDGSRRQNQFLQLGIILERPVGNAGGPFPNGSLFCFALLTDSNPAGVADAGRLFFHPSKAFMPTCVTLSGIVKSAGPLP